MVCSLLSGRLSERIGLSHRFQRKDGGFVDLVIHGDAILMIAAVLVLIYVVFRIGIIKKILAVFSKQARFYEEEYEKHATIDDDTTEFLLPHMHGNSSPSYKLEGKASGLAEGLCHATHSEPPTTLQPLNNKTTQRLNGLTQSFSGSETHSTANEAITTFDATTTTFRLPNFVYDLSAPVYESMECVPLIPYAARTSSSKFISEDNIGSKVVIATDNMGDLTADADHPSEVMIANSSEIVIANSSETLVALPSETKDVLQRRVANPLETIDILQTTIASLSEATEILVSADSKESATFMQPDENSDHYGDANSIVDHGSILENSCQKRERILRITPDPTPVSSLSHDNLEMEPTDKLYQIKLTNLVGRKSEAIIDKGVDIEKSEAIIESSVNIEKSEAIVERGVNIGTPCDSAGQDYTTDCESLHGEYLVDIVDHIERRICINPDLTPNSIALSPVIDLLQDRISPDRFRKSRNSMQMVDKLETNMDSLLENTLENKERRLRMEPTSSASLSSAVDLLNYSASNNNDSRWLSNLERLPSESRSYGKPKSSAEKSSQDEDSAEVASSEEKESKEIESKEEEWEEEDFRGDDSLQERSLQESSADSCLTLGQIHTASDSVGSANDNSAYQGQPLITSMMGIEHTLPLQISKNDVLSKEKILNHGLQTGEDPLLGDLRVAIKQEDKILLGNNGVRTNLVPLQSRRTSMVPNQESAFKSAIDDFEMQSAEKHIFHSANPKGLESAGMIDSAMKKRNKLRSDKKRYEEMAKGGAKYLNGVQVSDEYNISIETGFLAEGILQEPKEILSEEPNNDPTPTCNPPDSIHGVFGVNDSDSPVEPKKLEYSNSSCSILQTSTQAPDGTEVSIDALDGTELSGSMYTTMEAVHSTFGVSLKSSLGGQGQANGAYERENRFNTVFYGHGIDSVTDASANDSVQTNIATMIGTNYGIPLNSESVYGESRMPPDTSGYGVESGNDHGGSPSIPIGIVSRGVAGLNKKSELNKNNTPGRTSTSITSSASKTAIPTVAMSAKPVSYSSASSLVASMQTSNSSQIGKTNPINGTNGKTKSKDTKPTEFDTNALTKKASPITPGTGLLNMLRNVQKPSGEGQVTITVDRNEKANHNISRNDSSAEDQRPPSEVQGTGKQNMLKAAHQRNIRVSSNANVGPPTRTTNMRPLTRTIDMVDRGKPRQGMSISESIQFQNTHSPSARTVTRPQISTPTIARPQITTRDTRVGGNTPSETRSAIKQPLSSGRPPLTKPGKGTSESDQRVRYGQNGHRNGISNSNFSRNGISLLGNLDDRKISPVYISDIASKQRLTLSKRDQ